MISVSADMMNVIRYGSYKLHARCFVTRGGAVLATDIPIVAGSEEYDESLQVPERVTISVPRIVDGVNLEPATPTSPLAAYGQRLHVQLGVSVGAYGVEWFDRGEFLITASQANGDQVDVTAVGLLGLIEEARFVTPYNPAGLTLSNVIRNFVDPAVPVYFDSALADRAAPSASAGVNYDEDRLAALWEVLDAWPAVCRMMPAGFLYVYPDSTPTAADWNLFRFNRDDSPFDRATIIRTQAGSTRDGVANAVVARGTAADGGQVQAAAYDTSGSASAYGGPFNSFPVPYFYQSPLLTSPAQCRAAAQQMLDRRTRQTYARYDVQVVPVPILAGRDCVAIIDDTPVLTQATTLTVVETLTLPYTADGGPMTLTLRAAGPS